MKCVLWSLPPWDAGPFPCCRDHGWFPPLKLSYFGCKENAKKNKINWNFDSVDLKRRASSLSLTWSWFWFWFILPMRPHWFRAATIAGLIGNGFIFIPVGEIRTNRKLLKLRKIDLNAMVSNNLTLIRWPVLSLRIDAQWLQIGHI